MIWLESLASRVKSVVLKMVAADLILQEQQLAERIEEHAAELEASGKNEIAHRLRTLAHSDIQQLEGPRRGRPRKQDGGAE